jgi:TetR/AcrR family transcriptional regulator, cholesterol catabolism regulator
MAHQHGQRWHERREEIVDIAAEVFARLGYHATPTSELCTATGLGKGALYYYVESKENLLYLIHDRVMTYFLAQSKAIVEHGGSAIEQLQRLGELQLQTIAAYPHHVRVFLHEHQALTGERARQFSKSRREFELIVEGVLAAGVRQEEIEVQNVQLAALGFIGMHNYTYLWFGTAGNPFSAEEIARNYLDILVNGLKPRGSVCEVGTTPPSAS